MKASVRLAIGAPLVSIGLLGTESVSRRGRLFTVAIGDGAIDPHSTR